MERLPDPDLLPLVPAPMEFWLRQHSPRLDFNAGDEGGGGRRAPITLPPESMLLATTEVEELLTPPEELVPPLEPPPVEVVDAVGYGLKAEGTEGDE